MHKEITGFILSGGEGSRMGGVNKGLLPYCESTLIEHCILRLKGQVEKIVINANKDISLYKALGYRVWSDSSPSKGPLTGFLTGLEKCGTPYLMVVPCDTPHFPLDLVAQLFNKIEQTQTDVCMPISTDHNSTHARTRTQPTFCLLKKNLASNLKLFLSGANSRVQDWTDQQKCSFVEFNSPPYPGNAFANLNTPEELRSSQAEAMLLRD